MITNQDFAEIVIRTLRENLATDDVEFFGSHRTGETDNYSDVDVRARINRPLDAEFFHSLTACIEARFGKTMVRYDPDYRSDFNAQDLRFTLYFNSSRRIDTPQALVGHRRGIALSMPPGKPLELSIRRDQAGLLSTICPIQKDP